MTQPIKPEIVETDLERIAAFEGRVVVFADAEGRLDRAGRRVNRLLRGGLLKYLEDDAFGSLKEGQGREFAYPAGMAAKAVHLVKLNRRTDVDTCRKAGATIAKAAAKSPMLLLGGSHSKLAEVVLGVVLRAYEFDAHKTGEKSERGPLTVMVNDIERHAEKIEAVSAVAEGVFFTRDLVSEPSNILNTTEFAKRLGELKDIGVTVKFLEEADLENLGMLALLGVGQGSASPSKVVVMQWSGGGKAAPFALVGKGVCFDTGGISLKPAAGMENMTMDMGGAGVVAGVMKTLALRKAMANVVGVVGLVENMPDGMAQRPGDVVTTMKGDTVELINTDAEGRMVLCDILWYTQSEFKPAAMVDLATLTGAIVVSLGHENAGVFSNDDTVCQGFMKSAAAEGEGAWRMPLGDGYDNLLKSPIADFKHTGGRTAGAVTAAQFLKRFVKDEVPWIHLDIAGVTNVKSETKLAPKGATGWGVMALNRLIADKYET